MRSRSTAKVIKGVLYPSNEDIKSIVASLQRKVKTDPKVARLLKKDPRRTLAAFGLNEDVQRELLRDMGMKARIRPEWCICTECCFTCYCTSCCTTEVCIGSIIDINSIVQCVHN